MNPKAFEVTHRSVFAIVLPVTLASMTTPLIGITDTVVIGRLGDAAQLGGLAIGAILFDLIFASINFLRSGTTGLTAQALGAQDIPEQHAVLNRALLLALIIGVILIALSPLILHTGLYLMQPSTAVAEAVSVYFSVRILAAPLTLINYCILGWLLGLGCARQGFLLQVAVNGSNIVLSIYFGLIKGYGIAGVAWGTAISELFAVILGLFLVRNRLGYFHWTALHHLMDKSSILRMLSLNGDIMIRSFILLFVFSFFTAQGSRMGDILLAANAVLMNFFLLSAYILDGFATATEQLVGKAVGARYLPAFNKAVKISLIWSSLLASVLFVFLMLFGDVFISWLTTNKEVQTVAGEFVVWAALTGVFGVLAYQMDGVYIGATWSGEMRNMMIISLIVYLVAWWLFTPIWGNHGLWLSIEIFLGMRGLTLFYRLQSNRELEFSGKESA